jgi:hypothetical protein
MSAETLVTGLNVLHLAPMGLVSLVGTAALVKLISVFRRETPRPMTDFDLEVEDA